MRVTKAPQIRQGRTDAVDEIVEAHDFGGMTKRPHSFQASVLPRATTSVPSYLDRSNATGQSLVAFEIRLSSD